MGRRWCGRPKAWARRARTERKWRRGQHHPRPRCGYRHPGWDQGSERRSLCFHHSKLATYAPLPRLNPRPAQEPSPTKVVSSTTNLEMPVNTLDELGSYIVGCKSSPCHRTSKQGCKVQESCGGLLESYVLTTRCNIIGMSYRRLTFVINAIPIRFLTC